jgi:hypothetical protein
LTLFFIGLIIGIGCKFLPLPGGFSGALALNAAAVALVFYARVWNKPRAAVGAPNLVHGFSPQETISDRGCSKPDTSIVEKYARGSKRGRAIWKKKDFACAK